MSLVREQRELAIGVYRGKGRPRRLSALARRVVDHTNHLVVILSSAAGLVLAAMGLADSNVDTTDRASFLAGLFAAAAGWWKDMSTFEKTLTILAVASLFTGGGMLISGLVGRAMFTLAMRQMTSRTFGQLALGSVRGRLGRRLAQYLSRFTSREIRFVPKQLQKKFQKHAAVFKIEGMWNKSAPGKLQHAIESHVRDPATIVRRGWYHGERVTHFYNPDTGINVMRTLSGEFLSAWKPGHTALWHLLGFGRLGGG